MAYIPPVIVLPGITGTYLRDEYQLPPDLVWGILQREYERVALHPDNPRYEATEPARVRSDSIFEVAYRELVQELRYNLRQSEDRPVPVFPFGYDWRQPLDAIEKQLADFVDEVIERTKLLRHYAEAGFADDPKVNLVGHSMGGLIITGYLERQGKAARVAKVVTLAAAFQGSFEAVLKIATGTANLGLDPSGSREREAARMTPALYHLLPTIPGGLEIEDPSLPSGLTKKFCVVRLGTCPRNAKYIYDQINVSSCSALLEQVSTKRVRSYMHISCSRATGAGQTPKLPKRLT